MKKQLNITAMALLLMVFPACRSNYMLTSIDHSRIVVDSRYDAHPDETATQFLAPYKHKVDSIMCPVVGTIAHDMAADRPESELSNLLADILIWGSKDYNEQPVLAVYNMGGIRSSFTKGTVTFGDVLAVAPFENKIAFTTLTGEKLLELFQQIAKRGGEGVSKGTELVISSDGKLLSARLHGKEIDPQGTYRVTTIDYLLGGNDGMPALKEGSDLRIVKDETSNTRYIISNYFKEHAAQGKSVDAQKEGRIVVVEN